MKRWFRKWVLARQSTTFVAMGLSFIAFGVGTLNLFMLLRSNFDVVSEHGWQALMDGGALQFVELVGSGYVSLVAYVVFKACEHALVHHLTDDDGTE